MTDFKVNDRVRMDPAWVNAGARCRDKGEGTVLNVDCGGTEVTVEWARKLADGTHLVDTFQSWELVLVSHPREAAE